MFKHPGSKLKSMSVVFFWIFAIILTGLFLFYYFQTTGPLWQYIGDMDAGSSFTIFFLPIIVYAVIILLLVYYTSLMCSIGEAASKSAENAYYTLKILEKLNEMPKYVPVQAPVQVPTQAPAQSRTQTPTPIPTPIQTLVQAPVQTPTPVQVPVQNPVHTPIQTPVQAPVQTPTSAQAPVQNPVHTPIQTPVQTPVQTPTPVQVPVQNPVHTPIQTPVQTSAQDPVKNTLPNQLPDFPKATVTDKPTTPEINPIPSVELPKKPEPIEQTQPAPVAPQPEAATKICSACGKVVPATSPFCPVCGNRLA